MFRRTLSRATAILAAAAMLIAPTVALAQPASATAIDAGPVFPADTYTPYSKTHHNADGTDTATIYQVPAFTQDIDGWRRVDNTILPAPLSDTATAFIVPNAYRRTAFGRTGANVFSVQLPLGPVVMTAPGLELGLPALTAAGVTHPDVATDTQLTLTPAGAGVRTTLKLGSADAPTSFQFHLSDPLHQLGAPHARPDGGYEFDAEVEPGVRFVLPPAFAFVPNAENPEYAPGSEPGSAHLVLAPGGDGFDITEAVDAEWLGRHEFPVFLDPSAYFGRPYGTSTRDCHIVNGAVADFNYCTGNSQGVMEVGYGSGTDTNASTRRTMVQFNVNSVIPSPAAIDYGEITVWLKRNFQSKLLNTQAFRIGQSWTDGATWHNYDGVHPWTTQAGNFQEAVSGTVAVGANFTGGGENTAYHYPITGLTQQWLSGSAAQDGVLIKMAPESTATTVVEAFYSQEAADSSKWPYLRVDYRTSPTSPQSVSASPQDSSAYVSWSPPGSDGGSGVTGYTARAWTAPSGGVAVSSSASGCCSTTIGGLVNGQTYYVDVDATNALGTSAPSSPRVAVTPARPPAPPTSVTATAGDGYASVTWTPPADNGGAGITGYPVYMNGSYIGTYGCCGTGAVTGLANGTIYTFTVYAASSAGWSTGTNSNSVSPAGPPFAPSPTATPGNTQVTVSWPKPNENGSTITAYSVSGTDTTTGLPAPGNPKTVTPAAGSSSYSVVFTGLTNGHLYSFTVTATNAKGSRTSSAVTATPVTVPSVPRNVVATAANGSAGVTWDPPTDNGGSPVTGYDVYVNGTLTNTNMACCGKSITATNGTSYTFRVQARTAVGVSTPVDSNTVVPAAVPDGPNATAAAGNAHVTVSWQAPNANGAAITGYRVDATDTTTGAAAPNSPKTVSPTTFSVDLTALTNGHGYSFTVTATNRVGSATGPAVTATPRSVPAQPSPFTATLVGRNINLAWGPASDNGAAVDTYTLTGHDDTTNTDLFGRVCTVTQTTPCLSDQYQGAVNGHAYSFTVSAHNSLGDGPTSGTSLQVPILAPVLTKIASPVAASYSAGDVITYTVTIENHNNTALYAALTDAATGGLVLSTGAISRDTSLCPVTANLCAFTPGSLSVKDIALAPDSSRTITYAGQIVGKPSACSLLQNTASVTARTGTGVTGTAAPAPPAVSVSGSSCDAGLGLEPWWSFASTPLGPQSRADVNVANGNLVLQAVDSTPVQARGHLSFTLRRTYNSAARPTVTLPGSIGAGWQFNFGDIDDPADVGLTSGSLYLPTIPGVVDAALDPLSVVLVDRDGTRHVFSPNLSTRPAPVAVPDAGAALGSLAGTPQAALAPVALSTAGLPTGSHICADLTYSAPAGVHLSMWRYIATTSTTCGIGTADDHRVLGYATVRPDRLRSEYDALGRLLDMRDASGTALRYAYAASPDFNRLTTVYEPRSCTLVEAQPSGSTCRAFRFTYGSDSSGHGQVSISDPAHRITTYTLDAALGAAAAHLAKVDNPDGSSVNYTYGGCGGTADQLCAVSDPRGNTTSFAYTTTGLPVVGSPPMINTVTDRRGTTSTFHSDTAQNSPCLAPIRCVDTASHRRKYTSIDGDGRIGQLDEGDTSGTVLHRTTYTWDKAGSTCRKPDNAVDNNLCRRVRDNLGGAAGNEQTDYLFNTEGQLLSQSRASQGGALTMTWGYRAQYVPATGSAVVYEDRVSGGGNVDTTPATGSRGGPSPLFVVSDQIETLTPRGNAAAGGFGAYLTSYVIDADASQPINSAPAGTTCLDSTGTPTATGNTGLVCETDAPAFDATGKPTRTVNAYDSFGEKTMLFTAKALSQAGHPDAQDSVAGTARYTYLYYADSDTDLSQNSSAGGWLKAVSDPTSAPADPFGATAHFVAFGYDAAGNTARTWDRDATATHNATEYPGTTASPAPGPFAETLRGQTSSASAASALAAPWRYVTAATDPVGNTTKAAFDNNGNQTSITPPRGTSANSPAFDISTGYDAGDLPTSVHRPLDGASSTTSSYDAFGNRTGVTIAATQGDPDPTRHTTVYQYDAVNRLVATLTSRGPGTANDTSTSGAGCRAAQSAQAPLISGRTYCQTTTVYDAVDNAVSSTDAARQASLDTYDAAHRHLTHLAPRAMNTAASLKTQMLYDADGHVTDACTPRQFTEGTGGCTSTAVYAVHTSYDVAGRPVASTRYRDSTQPLTSLTSYDADGNPISSTDPRGALEAGDHTTEMTYDQLDRQLTKDSPRAGRTTRQYSPSGDLTALLEPGSETGPSTGDNPLGTTAAARRLRITGYTYDADHRVIDTVTALSVAVADPANDPANVATATGTALPNETTQTNLRTRVHYDQDGHLDRTFTPRAFLHPDGNLTAAPDLNNPDRRFRRTLIFDNNGRPVTSQTPRLDAPGGPAEDKTRSTQQASECRSGAAGYPAGVGVCVTDLVYDNADNLTMIKLPTRTSSGDTTRTRTASYTDDNLLLSTEGPNPAAGTTGEPTRATLTADTFDGTGRVLTHRAAPDSTVEQITSYSYTADGLISTVTGPPGQNGTLIHQIQYSYDAVGDPTRQSISRSTYNPTTGAKNGDRDETDLTDTTYYADGLVRSVVTGRTTATAATDHSSDNLTSYLYDGDGNPTVVTSPSANAKDPTNPGGVPTQNTYTPDNLLDTATVPVLVTSSGASQSRVTTYGYDPAGRKISASVALDNVASSSTQQTFNYYPSGLLHVQTGKLSPNPETITNSYDAEGHLTATDDLNRDGTVRQVRAEYMLDGLLKGSTGSPGQGATRVDFAYDGAGLTIERDIAPVAGDRYKLLTPNNDAGLTTGSLADRSWCTGPGCDLYDSVAFSYDRLGRRTQQTGQGTGYPNQTWSYDTDGLLKTTTVTNSAATPTELASDTYSHDELGRIISRAHTGRVATTSAPAVPVTYRYTYDSSGRVASFTDGTGLRTISYDHNGNRTGYGSVGQPRAVGFDYRADDSIAHSQPLLASGTPASQVKTYVYAAFGGVIADGCNSYQYDGFHRSVRIAHVSTGLTDSCPAVSVDYRYDGLDRQASRSDALNGANTTSFGYDGLSSTTLVEAGASYGVRYMLDGNGGAIAAATMYGGFGSFLHEDGTGSIGTVSNHSGNIECTALYDPFGSPNEVTTSTSGPCNSGSTLSHVFYRGELRDATSGNYTLGSRTYDPTKASFLTPDEFRTEGSDANTGVGVDPLTRNSYAYVNGDPVNYVDPSGHRPVCERGDDCEQIMKDFARAQANARRSGAARTYTYSPPGSFIGPRAPSATEIRDPAKWCLVGKPVGTVGPCGPPPAVNEYRPDQGRAVVDYLSMYGGPAADGASDFGERATVTVAGYETSRGTVVVSYTRYRSGLGDLRSVLPARSLKLGTKMVGRAFVALQAGVTFEDEWKQTEQAPTWYRVTRSTGKTASVVAGSLAGAAAGGEGGAAAGCFVTGPFCWIGAPVGGAIGAVGLGIFGGWSAGRGYDLMLERIEE